MLQKTDGIVLRTTPYSESSVIVKIYTEALGLQTYIVNGVRSAKGKGKAALYQHGNLLDLVVYSGQRGHIFHISEARLAHIYRSLPFDVVKSALLLFYIEILNKAIREEEANPALFHFLFESFIHLDETESVLASHPVWFLLGLSKFLGFYPSASPGKFFAFTEGKFSDAMYAEGYYLDAEISSKLRHVLDPEFVNFDQMHFTHAERRELLQGLLTYYRLHIEGFGTLRSLPVLEEILRA